MRRRECEEFAELLLRYSAGELDSESRGRLEQHFEGCEACRQAAAGQAAVWQALDDWEAPPLGPDFDRRLYRRIEAEVSWWDRIRLPFSRALVRRGLPIAAVAGLALMAGVIMQHSTNDQRPPERAILAEPIRPDQVDQAAQDIELLQQFNGMVVPDSTESRM